MHLRFLVDEDVDVRVSDLLRQRGHDVQVALKVFGGQTRDLDNMQFARVNDRIYLTRDRRFAMAHRRDAKRSAMLLLWGIDTQQPGRVRELIDVIEAEAARRPTMFFMWIGALDYQVQR